MAAVQQLEGGLHLSARDEARVGSAAAVLQEDGVEESRGVVAGEEAAQRLHGAVADGREAD